jgi:tripartite-type tricarboxylate transporter receptor subunit TctC
MDVHRLAAGMVSLCAALAALVPTAAAQQPTIKLVFPYAAGGSGDALTRILADALREATGRPAIVENRAGAAGRTGVQVVVAAAPDGGTLLVTPIAPISVFPHVYLDKLGYDPFKDLEPISQVAMFDFSLAVANRVPAKSVKELAAWLKANPNEQSFGSPGAGTLPYFFGLQVSKAAGIDLKHVSYRGSAAAMNDLVGGQVPIVFTTTADVVAQHKAGTIRVLATSQMQPFMAGVPTLEEQGFKVTGNGWYAVYAPAKTPAHVLDQYSKVLAAAVQKPEMKERFIAMGMVATGTTRARLAEIQKADSDAWGPTIRASGFTPQQ